MDDETRALLRTALPNFPDALLEEWLAPYVAMEGPPRTSGRWSKILGGKSLDFWRSTSWTLENVDLVSVIQTQLTLDSSVALTEMELGYFDGISNPYSVQIPDGRVRTERVLDFLRQHHVLPSPPALLCCGAGKMDIMDGNHRILAFVRAMKLYPSVANPCQDVWIARCQ